MEKIATALPGVWVRVYPGAQCVRGLPGSFMETYNAKAFETWASSGPGCRTTSPSSRRKARCGHSLPDRPMSAVQGGAGGPGRGEGSGGRPEARQSTYLRWILVELSAENKRIAVHSAGFGHGFVTLTTTWSSCTRWTTCTPSPATGRSATTTRTSGWTGASRNRFCRRRTFPRPICGAAT